MLKLKIDRQLQQDLDRIVEQLVTYYQPEKIILFGSTVYGSPRKDSDVDIAVIKETDKSYHDRVIEARRLVRTTTPMDIFVFTQREIDRTRRTNPLVREILERGTVIYGH